MEGPTSHFGSEHKDWLEAFKSIAAPPFDNCLMPLSELPVDYRKEIDRGSSTGWECIDRLLQGIRKGEVTVVTADTGVGKTTFALHLLVNCVRDNIPVWINSWEMKPEIIMRKIASIALKRPMKLAPFSEHESEQFTEWSFRHKIYINPTTIGMSLDKLSLHLVNAKQLGIEVVLLDHLDYLVNSRKEKMHEAIEETVKQLHELAFALSMHFVLICHPRQTTASGEEIGLHSLKGSSAIKQYADNVIILHRCARTDKTADPNKVKIHIAKNRMFGIEGYTHLYYEPLWDGYTQMKQKDKE